jgi:hypothetical protein
VVVKTRKNNDYARSSKSSGSRKNRYWY